VTCDCGPEVWYTKVLVFTLTTKLLSVVPARSIVRDFTE
jgi:hypothetical protein